MEYVIRQAETVLEGLPSWLWDGESVPVPIEDIADTHFGLLVRDVEDMTEAPGCPDIGHGQSLSGLLLPSRGEIWVNAAEARAWPPRRRFTIAHELGHWVMHQQGQAALFCRHGTIQEELPGITAAQSGQAGIAPPPLDPIEEEANRFAAELLMPEPMVRAAHAEVGGNHERLCEIFDCSAAAMRKRIERLFGPGDDA